MIAGCWLVDDVRLIFKISRLLYDDRQGSYFPGRIFVFFPSTNPRIAQSWKTSKYHPSDSPSQLLNFSPSLYETLGKSWRIDIRLVLLARFCTVDGRVHIPLRGGGYYYGEALNRKIGSKYGLVLNFSPSYTGAKFL